MSSSISEILHLAWLIITSLLAFALSYIPIFLLGVLSACFWCGVPSERETSETGRRWKRPSSKQISDWTVALSGFHSLLVPVLLLVYRDGKPFWWVLGTSVVILWAVSVGIAGGALVLGCFWVAGEGMLRWFGWKREEKEEDGLPEYEAVVDGEGVKLQSGRKGEQGAGREDDAVKEQASGSV